VLSADLEGTAAEGLGIRRSVVENLALKTLFYLGDASIQELADQLHIAPYIVEGIFQRLRKDQLMQAIGLAAGGHRVNLTMQGRSRALELLATDHYVGPVPVSFADYVERVKSQSVRDIAVTQADAVEAFRELVLEPETVAQLGASVVSGRAIFLYGPPGTGKTTVAEKLSDIFRKESVWVPYAVEVDGQIITVFDPHSHERVEGAGGLAGDSRWVRCRRPRLMVGGELTIDMLDLQFNPTTRYYTAPVQMRANNGFLIVDDFGRQRIPPLELLNRWVVPLDRNLDFLTLVGGKKIEIPFDMIVVFATNLDPATLVDEAFLRRIQTKIRLDNLSEQQFHAICRRVCEDLRLDCEPAVVEHLIQVITRDLKQPLRGCQPRDIIHHVCWGARYERRTPRLDRETVDQACRAYFLSPR